MAKIRINERKTKYFPVFPGESFFGEVRGKKKVWKTKMFPRLYCYFSSKVHFAVNWSEAVPTKASNRPGSAVHPPFDSS